MPLVANVKQLGRSAGVPSTLNVRNDTKTGEEIDFIIASRKVEDNKLRHFLSVPLYKSVTTDKPAKLLLFNPDENSNEVKVDLGKDVYFESNSSGRIQSSEKLSDEARRKLFQENWAISWDGFEPQKKLNTYVLHWNESSITWSVGSPEQPVERIKFTRIDSKKDVFPKGPLP